ncbi:MAG: type IV secretory system conjugative DNA transfer family protein [Solirubrobacteraceae bacterium]
MRRRTPYWTLPALALALALPLSWGLAALAAIALAQAGLGMARAAARRHAKLAAIEAAGPGVTIGLDPHGEPVHLADRQLAAHGLIVGASGAGKSTTLLGILSDRIARGLPVIAIDLKGSPAFARQFAQAANEARRPIRIWTPDGPSHYNPLAHGNPTELKDKLVATERFTEPHYQRAAERYVQTVLGVLRAAGRAPQLSEVVALMEPRRLAAVTRGLQRPLTARVLDYLSSLSPDQLSAVRGLGTRLAILTESDAGSYLAPGADAIDLRGALDGDEIVLFSLNSSVYGKLAAQIGTLVVQDLVSATGHRLELARAAPPLATVAVDEFSALGTDHLLALLARGREPGVSVLLATQELADLERAGRGFRDQVIGLTAVKIAHRQDVPASAQLISQMAGTERVWDVTRQLRGPFAGARTSRGSAREVERYIVHPNEIKTLATGQAVLLTKTPRARVARVGITPPQRPSDQAAPGVTR